MTKEQIAAMRAIADLLRHGLVPADRIGAASLAINTLADEVERLQREPLTLARAREWLDGEWRRLFNAGHAANGELDRLNLLGLAFVDPVVSLDALADLLVDAAAGRVK